MRKKNILTFLILLITSIGYGQIYYVQILVPKGILIMPEHGFLPGKKFQYYPTVGQYDLEKRKIRVEVYDDRQNVRLKKAECSAVQFTNTSEFENPNCIYKFGQYVDTLLKQSKAVVDLNSIDTLQIKLEGIDARLIGFGNVRVHGLCQIKVQYRGKAKTYCIDITDADQHSPISKYAFVTRNSATRIMASAAMREVIEQFIADIKVYE